MDLAISAIIFYVLAAAALLSAVGVVALRNPVSCALSMALCFGFVAAIFFGMGASFIGIAQIIIYAGAVLVLFLFIIMMLDVKQEEPVSGSHWFCITGVVMAGMLAGIFCTATLRLPGATGGRCPVRVLVENLGEMNLGNKSQTTPPSSPASYGGALPALCPEKHGSSDARLLGENLFSHYSITFAVLGFALLAGAVGAVALGRKLHRD